MAILAEDNLDNLVVATSKVNYGNLKVGDTVHIFKTMSGMQDLEVHKVITSNSDTVHYLFGFEVEIL